VADRLETRSAELARLIAAAARAANAVASALCADPRTSALEAAHEADAATDDLGLARDIVDEVLGRHRH
jgi:hypothetical protein